MSSRSNAFDLSYLIQVNNFSQRLLIDIFVASSMCKSRSKRKNSETLTNVRGWGDVKVNYRSRLTPVFATIDYFKLYRNSVTFSYPQIAWATRVSGMLQTSIPYYRFLLKELYHSILVLLCLSLSRKHLSQSHPSGLGYSRAMLESYKHIFSTLWMYINMR